MIRFDHVFKRYPNGREALSDLSFELASGEIAFLTGHSGAGKSSLLKLIALIERPTRGQLIVNGQNVGAITRSKIPAYRRQIGVAFQAASLDRKLTVRENLRHQGRLYGLSGPALATRIDEVLARLGVADRATDLVETLSGGLKRRVELAKALLHRPRLLLLDEPSTALDPAARGEVWRYLEQVRCEDGVTVALTTHLLDEADKAVRQVAGRQRRGQARALAHFVGEARRGGNGGHGGSRRAYWRGVLAVSHAACHLNEAKLSCRQPMR